MKHPSAEPGPALSVKRIAAIILAAGCSSRMGTLKPILELGKQTILKRAISLFKDFGIEDVIVVVGHRANEIISHVQNCGVRAITNEQFERGMFSSVQAGVNALRPESEAFFLLPVDIPLVRSQTIRNLLEAYQGGNSQIVFSAFLGKRGHPPLVSSRYRNEILSYSGDDGLRGFFGNHDRHSERVEVADEMILLDLDTPADYEAFVARFRRYDIPTPRELKSLLAHKVHLSGELIDHSRTVANLALRLASVLNRRGCRLDMELILAASSLHDIAKGQPNHAGAGAEMISRMGFSAVAQVVSAHTDITVKIQDPMTEREVVYLADKLVQGSDVTSLRARFEEANQRCSDDPTAHKLMLKRLEDAEMIKHRCESILGFCLESILMTHVDEHQEKEIQSLLAHAW
ncbi:MAG: DVU_1551 family NTP transferase [Desulfomonilaceae bacterium]